MREEDIVERIEQRKHALDMARVVARYSLAAIVLFFAAVAACSPDRMNYERAKGKLDACEAALDSALKEMR